MNPTVFPVMTVEPQPVRRTALAHAVSDVPSCPRWKRLMDIAFVLLASPFWLPLMIVIACCIKIVSPGCVFFYQERIGLNGRSFRLFKFRSMKVNVETSSHEKYCENLFQADRPMTKLDAAGDPRIIPLGKLLRASGLDELPQIFNVLRGEMSLVGPRPCTPTEFSRFEPSAQERFNALPGLTGYWQVNGKNKTTFKEMIAMDIHYAQSLSPGLDLSIILRTIPTLIGQVRELRAMKEQANQLESVR